MQISTLMYSVLPSKQKRALISKRNVRVIKEYLKKRKLLNATKEDEIARLKQLRKIRSINTSMYRRLKDVVIMTNEQKRIELAKAIIEKSVKLEKTDDSVDNQPTEDKQSLEQNLKNI